MGGGGNRLSGSGPRLPRLRGFWNRHALLGNITGSVLGSVVLILCGMAVPPVRTFLLMALALTGTAATAPVTVPFWFYVGIPFLIPTALVAYRRFRRVTPVQPRRRLEDAGDIRAELSGWLGTHDERLRTAVAYDDLDALLNLAPGSAKRYLVDVAAQGSWVVKDGGSSKVLLQYRPAPPHRRPNRGF